MPNARMLGAYIRQKMEERNVSVSSVASLLGCQEVEAERFLCGRVLATYPQMKQIAEYLGLSTSFNSRKAETVNSTALFRTVQETNTSLFSSCEKNSPERTP